LFLNFDTSPILGSQLIVRFSICVRDSNAWC